MQTADGQSLIQFLARDLNIGQFVDPSFPGPESSANFARAFVLCCRLLNPQHVFGFDRLELIRTCIAHAGTPRTSVNIIRKACLDVWIQLFTFAKGGWS